MRDDHPLRRAFAPDGRLDLRNLDRDTLAAWLTGEGEPLHRAHKVFQWAWGRGVDDF
ncbi:MAG: hypothetical protein ACK56F_01770, partial [bacterium]